MTRAALALLGVVLGTSACVPTCPAGAICAVAGTGDLGFNGEEGLTALQTRLASPTSVAIDPEGRPAVVDYSNMRVRVLDDGVLHTVAGNGTHAYADLGVDVLDSPLENPVDAAWGPDGHLWILPQHEGRVLRVDDDGRIQRAAGTGQIADDGEGLDALEASFGFGNGLALADDGTVYVSDNSFARVRRIDPDGMVTTLVGIGGQGTGTVPGDGPEVALSSPERIALDGDRLLVADALNHRVLAVDLATKAVTRFAGRGDDGFDGDGGPAVDAALSSPTGLVVLPGGDVIVSDLGNDALRVVRGDGTIETIAGAADGDPVFAALPLAFPMRSPAGMALGPDGTLWIAERGGHRLLQWEDVADAL